MGRPIASIQLYRVASRSDGVGLNRFLKIGTSQTYSSKACFPLKPSNLSLEYSLLIIVAILYMYLSELHDTKPMLLLVLISYIYCLVNTFRIGLKSSLNNRIRPKKNCAKDLTSKVNFKSWITIDAKTSRQSPQPIMTSRQNLVLSHHLILTLRVNVKPTKTLRQKLVLSHELTLTPRLDVKPTWNLLFDSSFLPLIPIFDWLWFSTCILVMRVEWTLETLWTWDY